MPQKTKKEKIAATIRKQYRLREAPPAVSRPEAVQPVAVGQYALTQEDLDINKYFTVDLRKSLILIAIIFTLEFLLYYATINNYFRF